MKSFLVLPLTMALAIACGGSSAALQDQARDSLPNKDSVTMNTPGGSTAASLKKGPSSELTADATSSDVFFGLTVSVAGTFNVSVAAFLDIISTVTSVEPTSCTATSCTWGPGSSALDFNSYELTVSKDADGVSFDWSFSGQAKSRPTSPFVVIASGVATPSSTAHHGSGNFTMDFDAAATLDGPHNATGKLVVSSYSNVGPAQLDVTYTGATDGTVATQLDNIAYTYADDATGGGDLQFALHNTTTGDDFSVHSRWKNDGSGRADVEGEGSGYQVSLSDCWGAAPFTQVYFTSTVTVSAPPFAGPPSGSAAQCAYPDASFSTLTAP